MGCTRGVGETWVCVLYRGKRKEKKKGDEETEGEFQNVSQQK